MPAIPGSTEVSFFFRPIGFRLSSGKKATVREVEAWKEKNPGLIKNIPRMSVPGIGLVILGLIITVAGFKNDNKTWKWSGLPLGLLGLGAVFFGNKYTFDSIKKTEEELTKNFREELKAIRSEENDEKKEELKKKLIEEYGKDKIGPYLLEYLDVSDEVAELLQVIDDKNITEQLVDILKDKTNKNHTLRGHAACALRGKKDPNIFEACKTIIKDKTDNCDVRSATAFHLAAFKTEESFNLIKECIKDEEADIGVRRNSLMGLRKSFVENKNDQALKFLIVSLSDEQINSEVRVFIAGALKYTKSKDALIALESIVQKKPFVYDSLQLAQDSIEEIKKALKE